MSQQKPNRISVLLDELSALPGDEVFDRQSAWEKLQARDTAKSGNKKLPWYRIAVAAVLVVGMMIFVSKTKKSAPVQDQAAIQQKIKAQSKLAYTSATGLVVANLLQKPVDAAVAHMAHNTNPKAALAVLKKSTPVTHRIIPVPAEINFSVAAPAPEALVATTTAPRLTVINNNELEDEDRIASQNRIRAMSFRAEKTNPKQEYAGVLNFRIYLKN